MPGKSKNVNVQKGKQGFQPVIPTPASPVEPQKKPPALARGLVQPKKTSQLKVEQPQQVRVVGLVTQSVTTPALKTETSPVSPPQRVVKKKVTPIQQPSPLSKTPEGIKHNNAGMVGKLRKRQTRLTDTRNAYKAGVSMRTAILEALSADDGGPHREIVEQLLTAVYNSRLPAGGRVRIGWNS